MVGDDQDAAARGDVFAAIHFEVEECGGENSPQNLQPLPTECAFGPHGSRFIGVRPMRATTKSQSASLVFGRAIIGRRNARSVELIPGSEIIAMAAALK